MKRTSKPKKIAKAKKVPVKVKIPTLPRRKKSNPYQQPLPLEPLPSTVLPEPTPIAAPGGFAEKLRQRTVTPESTLPHLMIIARAGTGKSTTLLQGVMDLCGVPTTITPSPQQEAVWTELRRSKGQAKTIHLIAFNRAIAKHLERKLVELGLPSWVSASTIHSMGLKAINRAFDRVDINEYRSQDILARLLSRDIHDLRYKKPVLVKAICSLVGLCKQNLTASLPYNNDCRLSPQESSSTRGWVEKLSELASYYDVDLNGCEREVFDLVPRVLEECRDLLKDHTIDYDDMVWLPVALDLPVFRYDMLLVDEAQDLNRCQQALTLKAGKRLIFCGDPKQSIYGFAGADVDSMPRLQKILTAKPEGVTVLPLTVTRRCGRAIVREAQRYVPDFEAHESNPEGRVNTASYGKPETPMEQTYAAQVLDGDMILCRVNAPLVSQCFRFLKAGRRANIQGRDIGQGLLSTINKLKADSIPALIGRLGDWLYKEQSKEHAKRNPSDARLIAIQDRHDCLVCFTEGTSTVDDVKARIERIFTDDKTVQGIRLSSVHKAKGLEAQRVFILRPEGATMPHPMAKSAWELEQELNILYVAITRAIEELVYVS